MLYDFIKEALDLGLLEADLDSGEVFYKGRPFKTISSRGYLVSCVVIKGIKKQVKAHQVVYIASGGLPKSKNIIDHINRNKLDNRLINLRLVSEKENSNNRRCYSGNQNPAAKINKEIAKEIRKNSLEGWSYSAIASNFKISKSLVASIVRRELWV